MTVNNDIQVVGSDIHPDIPMPAWAEARYVDDAGRQIVDERDFELNGVDGTIDTIHVLEDGSTTDPSAFVRWTAHWSGGPDEHAQLEIRIDDIDRVIDGLREVQRIVKGRAA